MTTTANTGQETPAPPSRLASVGGLVAVGMGVAAILLLALAAVSAGGRLNRWLP